MYQEFFLAPASEWSTFFEQGISYVESVENKEISSLFFFFIDMGAGNLEILPCIITFWKRSEYGAKWEIFIKGSAVCSWHNLAKAGNVGKKSILNISCNMYNRMEIVCMDLWGECKLRKVVVWGIWNSTDGESQILKAGSSSSLE